MLFNKPEEIKLMRRLKGRLISFVSQYTLLHLLIAGGAGLDGTDMIITIKTSGKLIMCWNQVQALPLS